MSPPPREPLAGRAVALSRAALLAAAVLAALEVGRVLAVEPVARSPLAGLLFVACLGIFVPFALLVAMLHALAEPWVRRLPRPSSAAVLASTTGVVVVWALLSTSRAYLRSVATDFPALVEAAADFASLFVIAAVLVGAWIGASAMKLAAGLPLPPPERLLALVALVAAFLLGVPLPHVLAGVHLSSWAVVPWLAALALLLVVLRARVTANSRRAGVVVALASAVSVASACGGLQHREAGYLFHSSTAVAHALVGLLAPLADVDGDGAAAAWLGGEDCAPVDPERGPEAREAPADGVDQDCSGGDAPIGTVAAASPTTWEGCRAPPPGGWSVLLITIDALRASALSPERAPGVAALARRSLWFTRAYAPATNTIPTFLSLFSGRAASDVLRVDDRVVLDEEELLARRLEREGYRTAFSFSFEAPEVLFHGFQEEGPLGVDFRPDSKHSFQSADITKSVVDQLARTEAGRPFFLWAHYPDAHAPYLPLPGVPDGATARQRYLAELHYVDRQIGGLLDALQRSARRDSTVVILTADHGEDLGERGTEGHGPQVFESSIHVPLALYAPGCAGGIVEQPVSVLDVYSTVGSLAGGRGETPSLFAAAAGEPRALPVVSEARFEGVLRRAVVTERYKLLVDVDHGGRLLFDLADDPGETRSRYGEEPVTTEMETLYQRWLDRPPRPAAERRGVREPERPGEPPSTAAKE